jgi:hypothetical protein
MNDLVTEMRTGEQNIIDVEEVSNCCGAHTTEPDRDGLARCLDCKEMCSVEPLEEDLT